MIIFLTNPGQTMPRTPWLWAILFRYPSYAPCILYKRADGKNKTRLRDGNSGYCSVSSNFSFSIRAGHGAKGDPWRNYMGKGKLEIGGMVIRISVQYRDSVECNIATDQAKLLHFSAPAFANVRLLLQIKNSWIPTVSVPKLLFCILRARHPKSFWDTLSQNYIKCFRHYSRWVFVSLNWDFFPVLTQISGRAWDWRSQLAAVVTGKYFCHHSILWFLLTQVYAVLDLVMTLAPCSSSKRV